MPAASATISREEAMAAVLEAPFLPDPLHMRVDHITVLLALLLEDPLHSTALSLFCKSNTPEDSPYIWSQWEQDHFQLLSSHPLAERTLAKDRNLTMLQTAYTTPKLEARDTHALAKLMAMVIPV